MINENNDLIYVPCFEEPVLLEGKTYWEAHSRIWSTVRIPSIIKKLYPALMKEQLRFQLRVFKNQDQVMDFLKTSKNTPMLLSFCIDKQK